MDDMDVNRPPESSQADVTLVARGITVTACVDISNDLALVVRPDGEGSAWKESVKPGDPVEVFWIGGYEERTLPARITEVDAGEDPRWHLAATGPAERSQRRKAVRARVELPVILPWAGGELSGTTVDVSEAGMRALVDGWGLPPESGTPMQVTITIDKQFVDLHGNLVWQADRGAQWLMAMQFTDVHEKDADLLRQRVFTALREERAAAMH
jgi:regulator of protease activity HflC (stomatin/prohibitin superfamily)